MNGSKHRYYRKEAGLAITQGWSTMAVHPKDLFELLLSNPPTTLDEKDRRIATLEAELRDAHVRLRLKDAEKQRAILETRHRTAMDLQASSGGA